MRFEGLWRGSNPPALASKFLTPREIQMRHDAFDEVSHPADTLLSAPLICVLLPS
jgi:hypothetical protein